jgi:hypothetical protein
MRLILDFCERVRIMELGLACTPNIQEFPRSRVMRYVPNFSQRPIQNVLPEAHAATGQQLIIPLWMCRKWNRPLSLNIGWDETIRVSHVAVKCNAEKEEMTRGTTVYLSIRLQCNLFEKRDERRWGMLHTQRLLIYSAPLKVVAIHRPILLLSSPLQCCCTRKSRPRRPRSTCVNARLER